MSGWVLTQLTPGPQTPVTLMSQDCLSINEQHFEAQMYLAVKYLWMERIEEYQKFNEMKHHDLMTHVADIHNSHQADHLHM